MALKSGVAVGPTAAVVVGFLVLVELTSGILQGYYTPLLTDIARSLGIHDADVNWLEAAQLMVSALVVPVLAKLGDMIGHRKVLLISTALTAAASWGVAFAPTFWLFLPAWALQGFYVVWLPLEIALIFSRSHHRPDGPALTRKAAGILVAGLEFGVIAGALAGGFLGAALPGQLWLVLCIPAVAVTGCFFVILFGVPESAGRTGGRIDTIGLAILSLGLLLITAGLTFMRLNGPGTWWAWAAVMLGIAAMVPFARHELGHKDPLVDIRLLRAPSMWPVQLTALLFGVSILGAQVPLSTFARTDPAVVGYGLGVGSGMVSVLIGVYVLALLVGALLYPVVTRWATPRTTLMGAAAVVGIGYLMFLPLHGSIGQVLVNMAIAGLGSGALVAALPSAAAAAAPLTQTGMATGLTNATKTIGGSFAACVFGIALAGQLLGGAGSCSAPVRVTALAGRRPRRLRWPATFWCGPSAALRPWPPPSPFTSSPNSPSAPPSQLGRANCMKSEGFGQLARLSCCGPTRWAASLPAAGRHGPWRRRHEPHGPCAGWRSAPAASRPAGSPLRG